MEDLNNPIKREEELRLERTIDLLEKTILSIEDFNSQSKGNIRSLLSEEEKADSSQAYIGLLIANNMINMAEKNYYSYRRSKDKPYFARIDVKLDDSMTGDSFERTEDGAFKVYIGKTSLYDAVDKEQWIVDWRAPISNLYYEGRLGENTYAVDGMDIESEMTLKRQFSIEKGKLNSFMDIDITATDSFLQASLSASADNRLKDIASTIQTEQNRVIRADLNTPLIVQGVAGSGKTTIALHRIAYFIYTYEKTFDPENYMIIAPNRLFINYISEVLPELGVEKVKQSTYEDFVFEFIGKKFKLNPIDKKLIYLIQGDDEKEKELLIWKSKFIGSMEFKKILDAYITDIEEDFVPQEDFKYGNYVLMKHGEIKRILLNELTYLPIHKRLKEIKKSLDNRMNGKSEEIIDVVDRAFEDKLNRIRAGIKDERLKRNMLANTMDKRDKTLKEVKERIKNASQEYLNGFIIKDVFSYYKDLITNKENLKKYAKGIPDEKIDYLVEKVSGLLAQNKLEFEDLAPLFYIQGRVIGFSKKITVRNIIIDEAQDFSPLQFYALKSILNTSMFTILGDISQGIHSYRGINNWDEVLDGVFNGDNPTYVTMEQSYRTTVEIMEEANSVIKKFQNPNKVMAKPVLRHGEKPDIKSFENEEELLSTLESGIMNLLDEGFKSIAIICKTHKECSSLKEKMDRRKKIKSSLVKGGEMEYEAGVLFVPSYLSKGLEFDGVFIVNIEDEYEENDLDIKLLYVSMTRALHRLHVYFMKGSNKLI